MKHRQLDSSGDWLFGRGLNDIATQNRAIGLDIKTRVLSWFGDCFFDQGAGIDYVNRLDKIRNEGLLELDIRNTILRTEGVTGIISFDFSLIDRGFVVDYSVETIYSKSYSDRIEGSI